MTHCKKFVEFFNSVGDETAKYFLETLCDMEWNHIKNDGDIEITSSHRHNSVNYTHSGTFTHNGARYGFIVDNGDWNGTIVRQWGAADDIAAYQPPQPTIYTFAPIDETLQDRRPQMWSVYLHWKKQPWFLDKVRGYNYDKHFAPGGKNETYYRQWAASKGMKIVVDDESGDKP